MTQKRMDRKASKTVKRTKPIPEARPNTCGRTKIEELPTKIALIRQDRRLNNKFSHNTMIAKKIHIDSVRSCNHQERIDSFGLKIDELPDACPIYGFLQEIVTGEEAKNG